MKALTDAFEKKYGVKTSAWRGSSENIVQRAVVESRGKRPTADLFESDSSIMEALHREKLLQEVTSPYTKDLMPQALAHKDWVGTRIQIIAAAYNANLVKREDAPKTYADLADPKWKGKLGIEAEDADWFATVVTSLGEEKGLDLFKKIVSANGVSVRKGHTLLANLVVSGEIPFSITTYVYKVAQYKASGAPIDWLVLPPAVARVNGVGVATQPPHPHAALLFYDFMLSDGQDILAKRDFFPTNQKVKPLPEGLDPVFVDSAKMIDEGDKWDKLYKRTVLEQSR
jgi:iron(III) transport system substrate-binding protein